VDAAEEVLLTLGCNFAPEDRGVTGVSDEINKIAALRQDAGHRRSDVERHQHGSGTKQRIEARNHLDGLVYKVEKDSKEWVDRLDTAAKTRLDEAVEAGKQALRTGDNDGIKKALEELNAAYSAAGASLYQQAQSASAAEGSTEPPAGGEEKKEDVVEADYEIVDENKK